MQRHAAENLDPGGGELRRSQARTSTAGKPTSTAHLSSMRQSRLKQNEAHIHRETSNSMKILTQFSDTFDAQLRDFLDKLWTNHYRHHVQLSNLCVRLDYNGFYSSQFAENI